MIRTSVIIPVYNTAEYLEECVESVLAQTQKEIEIILVDDGSTDGSLEMCEKYEAEYECVSLIRQEHEFQGTARNRGLEAAKGEYVYFMDSDDIILPGLFERCYDVCRADDLDFVMFEAEGFRYDENDRELAVPDDIFDRSVLGIESGIYTGPGYWTDFYNSHGVLFVVWLLYIRRSFLIENDLFFEERTYFEDNDWTLRTYIAAQRIRYLPEVMQRHRWRRGSNMLDGFTVDLMRGCFRMHDCLGRIAEANTDAKNRMAEDVILLNIRRFERLAEISPEREHLYERYLRDFCEKLKRDIEDGERSGYLRMMDLAALDRIAVSTAGWKNASWFGGRITPRDLPVWLPGSGPGGEKRILIYGTGNIGALYMRLLERSCDTDGIEVCFAETDPEEGATFLGRDVIAIKDAHRFRPDAVVIASTKYSDEMEQAAAKAFGIGDKIKTVPKELKFFL